MLTGKIAPRPIDNSINISTPLCHCHWLSCTTCALHHYPAFSEQAGLQRLAAHNLTLSQRSLTVSSVHGDGHGAFAHLAETSDQVDAADTQNFSTLQGVRMSQFLL